MILSQQQLIMNEVNEDEDPIARKRRKANERQAKWLANQSKESRNRIRAAIIAAQQQSRARREAKAEAQRLRIEQKIQARLKAKAHRLRIEQETNQVKVYMKTIKKARSDMKRDKIRLANGKNS